MASRFWPTILLIGIGEVIAIVVGLGLGAYAGWRRGSAVDRFGNGFSLILYSMPYFVIGMPLIIIFAADARLVPDVRDADARARGYADPIDQLLDLRATWSCRSRP